MADHPPDGPPPGSDSRSPLDAVLAWVERKRLQAPAAMLLEMHRPLMGLAWPAAVLLGGFLAPFIGPDYYQKIEALRDPAALDRLLERLKTPADKKEG
jgi:hypothetical protein